MRIKIPFVLALLTCVGVALDVYFWQKLSKLQAEKNARQAREIWTVSRPGDHLDEKAQTSRPPDAAERSRRSQETKRRFERLWEEPAFVRLMLLRLRLPLDRQYGDFFQTAPMEAEQLERLKDALVEKQLALADSKRVPPGLLSATEQSALTNEADAGIAAVLGNECFPLYLAYEKTWPLRRRILELAERLAFLQQPLDRVQIEELVQTLERETSLPPGAPSYPAVTSLPSRVLDHAKTILTKRQFEALLRFEEEDRAIEELAQIRRGAIRTTPSATTEVPSPAQGS